MKKVEVYRTLDGRMFEKEEEALKHETLVRQIAFLKSTIYPRFDLNHDADFSNGDGYVQLTEAEVNKLTDFFIKAVAEHHPDIADMAKDNPKGFVGRYLDDGGSELYEVWTILKCIDNDNRLWGQPYYAAHPDSGKQIKLER